MNVEIPPPDHIRRLEDGSEGILQRHFRGHDRAAVWQFLTEPECMAQWLAPGTIEPRKGGKATIDFEDSGTAINSQVLDYDTPRLLAYSWSSNDDPLRPLYWELNETDNGTHLTLTVITPAGEDAAKACAGFVAHLEMLGGALEGVPIQFPFDLYVQAREDFNKQLQSEPPPSRP